MAMTLIMAGLHPTFLMAQCKTLLQEGFREPASLMNRWTRSGVGGFSVVKLEDGSSAAHFRIERQHSYRSELHLTDPGALELGVPYTFRLSVMIPQSFVRSRYPDVVAQWYSPADRLLGEVGHSPPISLRVGEDGWFVEVLWDDRRITPAAGSKGERYQGIRRFELGPVAKGSWSEFVFQVTMADDSSGRVDAWRDGVKLVSYRGPDTFNDLQKPYLKIGLYSAYWNSENDGYYFPDTKYQERDLYIRRIDVQQGSSCVP